MAVKDTHSVTSPGTSARGACTVYFSRSLTRTFLTVALLVVALVLIVTLG